MKNLILGLLLWPSVLFAGVTNGGGGNAVVCRDSANVIQSAQLLDLYEAQAQYGLTLKPSVGTYEQEIQSVADRFKNQQSHARWDKHFNFDASFISEIASYIQLLPPGTSIKPIDDSLDVLIPDNCKVEQLAYYKEAKLILVNSDIWKKLDAQNQAALVIHEALYRGYRLLGSKDSRDARKVVGYMFSDKELPRAANDVPENGNAIICSAGNYMSGYLVKDAQGDYTFSITKMNGYPVFVQTNVPFGIDGKYISGETPGEHIDHIGSRKISSNMMPRVFERLLIRIEPTKSKYDYVQLGLKLLEMEERYDSNTKTIPIGCGIENMDHGFPVREPIKGWDSL